jgi:hypothetical protein
MEVDTVGGTCNNTQGTDEKCIQNSGGKSEYRDDLGDLRVVKKVKVKWFLCSP